MATTTNLTVTKIDSAQAQKEVTANEAFDVFDAALSEIAIEMTDANYTLSTSTVPQEWQYGTIKFTGTLTAGRNIIVPTNKKKYTIVNATTGGFDITVKTSGGSGVGVSNGTTAILRCDGTNVAAITTGTGVGTVTSVNVTQPAAGITATGGPVTTSGSITLALANDLAAVEGLSTTGIVRRTATDTWSAGTAIATAEIADDAVTYAKMQNIANQKILGRTTASTGDVEEIDFGNLINGMASKTTPIDGDCVSIMDSEASNVAKKLSWSNIKTALNSLFIQATSVPVVIQVAASDETTAISTGTAKLTFRMPHAMTLTAVRASLTNASSSGVVTIDINEGGTSILSTKLTIDASELTSTTAETAAVISDSSLADDAEITIDFDTAGSNAKGVKITLIGTRAV